jgi:hypothetical protein
MEAIQIIQVTKDELVQLINEAVKTQISETQINETQIKETQTVEFLTRKETAKMFGISTNCLHNWVNDGIVKMYKMGNRSFFKYSELIETLYNNKKK